MKRFVLFCMILVFEAAATRLAQSADDHLIPIPKSFEEYGSSAAYRKLYEQKLLLTPGNIARYVYLPAGIDEESAVSVYQASGRNGGNGFWVTATRASGNLRSCIPQAGGKRPIDPHTITILRCDAALSQATALAVHKVWLTMLAATRSPPSGRVLVEGSTQIFSATTPDGNALRAQTNTLDGNSLALIELGDLLSSYCHMSPSNRPTIARKIESQASRLLRRLDGSKRSVGKE